MGVYVVKKISFLALGIDKSMTVFIPQRYGSSQKYEKTLFLYHFDGLLHMLFVN